MQPLTGFPYEREGLGDGSREIKNINQTKLPCKTRVSPAFINKNIHNFAFP